MKQPRAVHGPARVVPRAPEDLTLGRLARLGEGIGRVVYASDRWVVKRERHPSEILSLIFVWKFIRRLEKLLPGERVRDMLANPGPRIRLLSLFFQAVVLLVPRGIWYATHSGEVWLAYVRREVRGRRLADARLAGTGLLPERIAFPPTHVKVGRWPGWMIVNEATERVEATLHDRINELAQARRFDQIEVWLQRLLEARKLGWEHGVFSLDAHLKNFGVTADRVVLLDSGGLTDRWSDIQARLAFDADLIRPHEALGLAETLRDRPDIAERFDARWHATVNPEVVRAHWTG